MATEDPTCSRLDEPISEDMGTESVVIAFVLAEHPSHLTIPELSLAINRKACGEFADDDAVERAISELVGAGLLHLAAGFVLPTRAAIYFDGLEAA